MKSFFVLRQRVIMKAAIVVTLALAIMVLIISAPSFAAGGPQGDIPDELWAKMPIPSRIEAAYENGAIDAETRILYLAYAVWEPSSLPKEYLSDVPWFGTSAVREVWLAYNNQGKPGTDLQFSTETRTELDRILSKTQSRTNCDRDDGPNDTTSTYFAINYDTIGGGLTIDDYKTSLDNRAWKTLVVDYGWARPPVCGDGQLNCGSVAPPDGKYPVQVVDLGNSLFGYVTTWGGEYAGYFPGDNPHTAITELASITSCMVLNSNYAQLGGSAQDNLDGTTGHEFVHAVQYGWGDPGTSSMATMWIESTAAYFEDESSDAGNSQYIYLYGAFGAPRESYNDPATGNPVPAALGSLGDWPTGGAGPNEYGNFLFFRYIAEQFGGANSPTGGHKVIKKFFENVATNSPVADKELQSFKDAVQSFALGGGPGASDFKQVFHDYAIALKFMKDCDDEPGGWSGSSKHCWEEGEYDSGTGKDGYRWEALARYDGDPYNGDAVPASSAAITSPTGSYSGKIKNDYGIQWVDLPNSGTYKVTLASVSGAELKASVVCDKGSTLQVNTFTNLVTNSTPHGWGTYNANGCNKVVLVITDQSESGTVLRAADANGATAAEHNYTVQLAAATNPGGPTAVRLSGISASGMTGLSVIGLFGLALLGGLFFLGARKLTQRQ